MTSARKKPYSHPADEYFVSLVAYLRHLVDEHDIEETGELWRSGRDRFDELHAAAHEADRLRVAKTEQRLRDQLVKDRQRPSRCSQGARAEIIVHVSGTAVGLAYAIETMTGERDALRRVAESLED